MTSQESMLTLTQPPCINKCFILVQQSVQNMKSLMLEIPSHSVSVLWSFLCSLYLFKDPLSLPTVFRIYIPLKEQKLAELWWNKKFSCMSLGKSVTKSQFKTEPVPNKHRTHVSNNRQYCMARWYQINKLTLNITCEYHQETLTRAATAVWPPVKSLIWSRGLGGI